MSLLHLPDLPVRRREVRLTERFGGIDLTPAAAEGSFTYMENLCADGYPHLTTRPRRGVISIPRAAESLSARETLCFTDGGDFVITLPGGGERRIPLGLTPGKKEMAHPGALTVILPDRVAVHTVSGKVIPLALTHETPRGVTVQFHLCRPDGAPYLPLTTAPAAPEAPQHGDYWLDTADTTARLYRWSEARGEWERVSDPHLAVSCPGIGLSFARGDGVTLSGILPAALDWLNGTHLVAARTDDRLILAAPHPLAHPCGQTDPVTVRREMPRLSHPVVSGGRLWGCETVETADGGTLCRIRASRAGDPTNWEGVSGSATDPVTLTYDGGGEITAAFGFPDLPVFFTEDRVIRVEATAGGYRLRTTLCDGVAAGCGGTLAPLGDRLCYLSRRGLRLWKDGKVTAVDSSPLSWLTAVQWGTAAALGDAYHLAVTDREGKRHLLTWRADLDLWHRADGIDAADLCAVGEEVYLLDGESGAVMTLLGSGLPDPRPIRWEAETVPLTADLPQGTTLARLDLRMSLSVGGRAAFFAEYDGDGQWHHLATLTGGSGTVYTVPLKPRRCDTLRLRLVGEGDMALRAMARSIETTGRK